MSGLGIAIILLTLLHVTVCFILIAVVLFQQGKGADLASAFGGGSSQTAFGARQASTLLSKLTTAAAVAFMVSSLSLAIARSMSVSGGDGGDYPEAGATTQEQPVDATGTGSGSEDASAPEAEAEPAPEPEGATQP